MSLSITDHMNTVVRPLAKPGEDILATLTPEKAHLWHMGSALLGEGVELVIADPEDADNGIEEMGDASFYLVGIAMQLEYAPVIKSFDEIEQEFTEKMNQTGQPINVGALYLESLNIVFNRIKKYCIYNKEMVILDELKGPLDNAFSLTNYLANQFYQMSLEDILEANSKKLISGEKPRYASGAYSDQQAVERADKDGKDSE